MKFTIDRKIPNLRVQTIINDKIIGSNGYNIYKVSGSGAKKKLGSLPNQRINKFLSNSRLLSRGLRLGISQIKSIPNEKFLIHANKNLLISNKDFSKIDHVSIPSKSYQLMDHNICTTDNFVYYSEYIQNRSRNEVNIYRSTNGIDWEVIHTFPSNSIKHIHAIQEDPFEDKIWFATGDSKDEIMIGKADYHFSDIKTIGRGEPKWKTLEFKFKEEKVYWGTDTLKDRSFLVEYDRTSSKTREIGKFDGPIYNLKILNNLFLVITVAEGATSETDNKAHIWASKDLKNWKNLISFKKDYFPYLMGYGRLIFPNNIQNKIIFSGLGLKNIDNTLITGKTNN